MDNMSSNEDLGYENLMTYQGAWYIPDLNNDSGGYISFTIENHNDQYYFAASGLWESGNYRNQVTDTIIRLERQPMVSVHLQIPMAIGDRLLFTTMSPQVRI